MTQIIVNIKDDSKIQFFLELVESLDFVEMNIKEDGDSNEEIIENIKRGLAEVKLAKQGKLKTSTPKEFFDEL